MFMTMKAIKMKHFFNQQKLDSLSDAVHRAWMVSKKTSSKKNARQQQEKLKQSRDRNVVRKKVYESHIILRINIHFLFN